MKGFKLHITEEKKKYTAEEMYWWCVENIKNFNNGQDVEIDVNKQKIVNFDDVLHIKSEDILLPNLKFESDGYILECPNLKTLNLKQFSIDETHITFKHTDALNYDNIIFPLHLDIFFDNCKTIHPNIFTKNRTSAVNFNCTSNPYVTNFSYYRNSKIFALHIAPYQKFKNMSELFTIENKTEDFSCTRSFRENVDIVYTAGQIKQINIIMDDFIRILDKHEYAMDFTVAMLDAGFEDEI